MPLLDLVAPVIQFGLAQALSVHLQTPQTRSVARQRQGRLIDSLAASFSSFAFKGLSLSTRLSPGPLHTFRRQWFAVLQQLAMPFRPADRAAPPGVLRASSATHSFQITEVLLLFAWGGP